MMKQLILMFFCMFIFLDGFSQKLKPIILNDEWISKIEKIAPSKPKTIVDKTKNILVFSAATGYKHWIIPFNNKMLEILGKKSETFSITIKYSIDAFETKNLQKYDAVILNNTCSKPNNRNLFYDLLKEKDNFSSKEIFTKANQYEKNLIDYVKNGGGLVVLHGAITAQNNSTAFSEMVGGSFDYHPIQQKIKVELVDENHKLTKHFKEKSFIHIDEPYFLKNAYFNYNFKPLLSIDASQLKGLKTQVSDKIKYISWIRKHKKGRVFFCSLSHNAQSYANPAILKFILNGILYASGTLNADDTSMKQ